MTTNYRIWGSGKAANTAPGHATNTINGRFCLHQKTAEGSWGAALPNSGGAGWRAQPTGKDLNTILKKHKGTSQQDLNANLRIDFSVLRMHDERRGVSGAAQRPFANSWQELKTCSLSHAFDKIARHCTWDLLSCVFAGPPRQELCACTNLCCCILMELARHSNCSQENRNVGVAGWSSLPHFRCKHVASDHV